MCKLQLFIILLQEKFDSGSGWPSFYDLEEGNSVKEVNDYSYGMTRVEVNAVSVILTWAMFFLMVRNQQVLGIV